MSTDLIEKSTVAQILNNFPNIYRNWLSLILSYKSHPIISILSQINPIHSTSVRSIIILPSYRYIGLPRTLFPSAFPITRYMACPPHPLSLDFSNYASRGVQIAMLLIMQVYPASYDFIPLWSKHSPQHPVHKHPQPIFHP
jgi:hypothetical protein